MSLIGKKPIAIPAGVSVKVSGDTVTVSKDKATLSMAIHPATSVAVDEDAKQVKVSSQDDGASKKFHGLTRALVANMVQGVSQGFEKKLQVVGVGFRVQAQGNKLVMNIGFCHQVELTAPDGVTLECPSQTDIVIKGADKQKVGQFAAQVRAVRPPEPYKGKGIRYIDETVRRKAGKALST